MVARGIVPARVEDVIGMPAIELSLTRLGRLLGRTCKVEDLELDLQWIGLDLDDVQEDTIKVEYNPNRPDFSSPEGIARALKGYYDIETGLPTFPLGESGLVVTVDPAVDRVRPFIATAVVKNIDLDEEEVATLMNVQEDLHWAIGRDRRKVAIGVHDFDKITPPFTYTAVKPDAMKFEPLQMPGSMLTPAEILVEHPKGIAYAHILKDADVYPMIFDAGKNVISFPPVINGTLTMVTDVTRNLFIDMTGTDRRAVHHSLNVLCTMLHDMGCKIETCTNVYQNGPEVTPDFSPKPWQVSVDYVNSYLGLSLTPPEVIKALQKVRFGAKPARDKRTIDVLVPCYRGDLLHPVDLTEEVAIGFGYNNLPVTIPTGGTGSYHHAIEMQQLARKIMVGLGFQEVVNFILTNKDKSFGATRREWTDGVVIKNPVSKEYNTTRQDLLSGLLQNLQDNKHEPIPVHVFEVGDVILLDEAEETGAKRHVHLACASLDKDAEYTHMRSVLDSFMKSYNAGPYKVVAASSPFGIEGRTGNVIVGKDINAGIIGELHPEILNAFDLDFPVSFLELDLERL